MATPTPLAGKHPSAATAVATPPVSTPFSHSQSHPAFSPHGPRSVVPSPQQVKKSPANSQTIYGYPGVQGYDSPSAAMALGGIGMEGLGMGLDTVRGDEDERRRRLSAVVDILKVNKGRMSEAGIERLARKVGLECLWESHMGSGESTRTLIIAGSTLALDIDFAKDVVQKVSLSFPEAPEMVTRHTGKAGKVLTQDLSFMGTESPLTKKLDRFAANLETLAVLDRLSVIPGLNCYEAVAGVYESLERLYEWEVVKVKEAGEQDGSAERTVVCTKSGRPTMHARDRLGLSLDYWQDGRRLQRKKDGKIWALLLECAALPAMGLYPPVRVSPNWISSDIQKASQPAEELFAALAGGPILDWLEPEDTLLPSADASKADAVDTTTQKYPEVMFVAKFDPPVIVPYSIAVELYNSTHADMDMYQQSVTYDSLLFPHGPGEKVGTDIRRIPRERQVPIFNQDGEKSTRLHHTELWMDKTDWGRTLTDISFSHPRQLVEMLPCLRQYAFITTILRKIEGPDSKNPAETKTTIQKSKRTEFEDFMSQDSIVERPFRVDVHFSTQPEPRLRVSFPFKKRPADIIFAIRLNGAVDVVSQNILEEEGNIEEDLAVGKGKMITVADLGRMLEITEDVGIWVEFVKRRLG